MKGMAMYQELCKT